MTRDVPRIACGAAVRVRPGRRRGLALALVLAAAVARVSGAEPASTNDVHFYFVQITDTHVGTARSDQRTRRAVEAVNALPLPIACVVHTGDITADRMEAAGATAREILAGLRLPLHVLPGNHDLLPRRREATLKAYRRAFGEPTGRAEYHGVVFLFAYTEPLTDPSAAIEGYEPLRWLEEALQAAGDKPVIVFQHTPPVDDFYRNAMHPGWPPETRERWVRLLNAHRVKGVIAGHFHRDEVHWLGDVPLFVSAPVAGYWGRQGSFRIFEYRNGRLAYRTCYLEGAGKETGSDGP